MRSRVLIHASELLPLYLFVCKSPDACVYDDAILNDLQIPHGKYLLANARYPLQSQLLVPYRGVHYHLAEWGHANIQ